MRKKKVGKPSIFVWCEVIYDIEKTLQNKFFIRENGSDNVWDNNKFTCRKRFFNLTPRLLKGSL